jgi:class 3 adenylate cyclase
VVAPKDITTADSLLEALDARPSRDPAAQKVFDDEVWKHRGATGAILVTDLSGFTRITKAHGILHFLSIFRRCQRACVPLIEMHHGKLLKQEADDFVVFFDDAGSALQCAIDMLSATRGINKTLAEEDKIYMCIGLEYGPLLRLDDDAFGDTVNVAFKLGEDVARPMEILIGKHAFDRITQDGFDLSYLTVSELQSATTGAVALAHHSIRLKEEVPSK